MIYPTLSALADTLRIAHISDAPYPDTVYGRTHNVLLTVRGVPIISVPVCGEPTRNAALVVALDMAARGAVSFEDYGDQFGPLLEPAHSRAYHAACACARVMLLGQIASAELDALQQALRADRAAPPRDPQKESLRQQLCSMLAAEDKRCRLVAGVISKLCFLSGEVSIEPTTPDLRLRIVVKVARHDVAIDIYDLVNFVGDLDKLAEDHVRLATYACAEKLVRDMIEELRSKTGSTTNIFGARNGD